MSRMGKSIEIESKSVLAGAGGWGGGRPATYQAHLTGKVLGKHQGSGSEKMRKDKERIFQKINGSHHGKRQNSGPSPHLFIVEYHFYFR